MIKKKTLKEIKNLKKFFLFLWKKKLSGFNFLLTFFVVFLLPGQGYYDTLRLSWQNPKVQASHFVIPQPFPIPKNRTGAPAPLLSAKSALVVDLPSWVVMYEKNPNLKLLPASTTKIMTALVSLDYYPQEQVLEVPDVFREGQDIKLQKGEKMTVENLLYALLVASANDAAETLAANYPGGRTNFIEEMNQKAKSLKLANTYFVNPTGIDEEGEYTSASDLARLAKSAIQNPVFARIVATDKVVVYSSDSKISHPMSNINVLLGKIPGIKGIKTGWTINAGECLVGIDERDGRKVITVVLGSQDRFGETEKLLDWVFGNFSWETPG
ncbi:MAG: D-alanyl-D-alanine carboxypeptidase family protein [Patescibacteria group bacterium]